MLDKVQCSVDIEKIAKRILDKIKEPIVIDTHTLFVSASIGISLYPDNGKDEISLLKHADIAMYNAKEIGRNGYQFGVFLRPARFLITMAALSYSSICNHHLCN